MEKKTFYNQISIPPIGYGVYQITDQKLCEECVVQAIQSGYRLIDTAAAYENEEAVGRALKRCGIPREELFITTKLWVSDTSYEKVKDAFNRSLKRLGLDYIDLYLIHQPYNDYYGAWRAMEELYQEGKVKAIGVDNFKQDRLADFIYFNKIKPMVNMVECNPLYQRENDLTYLKENGIQMLAWSPLASGKDNILKNEYLKKIAQKYNKSIAQITLRWLYQRGIIPLVKSTNSKRLKENLDIFDFELSKEDMKMIAKLDQGHTCFHERDTAEKVNHFLKQAFKFNV